MKYYSLKNILKKKAYNFILNERSYGRIYYENKSLLKQIKELEEENNKLKIENNKLAKEIGKLTSELQQLGEEYDELYGVISYLRNFGEDDEK